MARHGMAWQGKERINYIFIMSFNSSPQAIQGHFSNLVRGHKIHTERKGKARQFKV
jgi:hypothetical protein